MEALTRESFGKVVIPNRQRREKTWGRLQEGAKTSPDLTSDKDRLEWTDWTIGHLPDMMVLFVGG